MIDMDKIAGRMLDLESKYYELQDKYQLLIHHYEDLKAEYEAAERSEHWKELSADEMETLYQLSTYIDGTDYIYMLMMAQEKLKDKNEAYRTRHRDNIRSQHDLDGSN
jgi:hypothetical protein